MDKDVFTNVMYFVFPYMTKEDIFKVGQAYSFLDKYVEYALVSKSSYYFTVDVIALNYYLSKGFEHMHFGSYLKMIPGLGITFTNVNTHSYFHHGTVCNKKVFNYFIVNLRSYYDIVYKVKEDPLIGFHLPVDDFVDVTILSFMPQHITSKFQVEDIRSIPNINNSTWLADIDRDFPDFRQSNNLIVFCRNDSHLKCENLFKSLNKWILFSNVCIWYAVVDEVTICRNKHPNGDCRISTEFIFIFLKHKPMKTYVEILTGKSNTPDKIRIDLEKFKSRIDLSSRSIAFMHISKSRVNKFYGLDTTIFREIFPDVIFFLTNHAKSAITTKNSYYLTIDVIALNYYLSKGFEYMHFGSYLKMIPGLGITFTNVNTHSYFNHGTVCNKKVFNYFIVNLRSYYDIVYKVKEDPLIGFHLPVDDFVDVTILSFISHHITSKVKSGNICFINDFKITSFLLDDYPNIRQSNNLIIFCRKDSHKKCEKLFKSLDKWNLFSNIKIWFAIVDDITICRNKHTSWDCRISTEFIFLFIKHAPMRTYSNFLSTFCDSEEETRKQFTRFRGKMILSSRSIAFMHICQSRVNESYELQTTIFREIFPDVILYPIYGTMSCFGRTYKDFLLAVRLCNKGLHDKYTTILILSYV
ncbi:hypothetical protein M0802_005897 [Mischocyttarus mexicanus]|nr:hypothetical protein M0802_005897 [Mischocyttarus mexicanus]